MKLNCVKSIFFITGMLVFIASYGQDAMTAKRTILSSTQSYDVETGKGTIKIDGVKGGNDMVFPISYEVRKDNGNGLLVGKGVFKTTYLGEEKNSISEEHLYSNLTGEKHVIILKDSSKKIRTLLFEYRFKY